MQHEAELSFFTEILKNSHIPCHVFDISDDSPIGAYDFGLRRLVVPDLDYREEFLRYSSQCRPGVFYRTRDPFLCCYYLIRISDDENSFVLVGPYTEAEVTTQDILKIAERYNLPHFLVGKFEKLFRVIPILEDSTGLLVLINSLGKLLWGDLKKFSLQDVYDDSLLGKEPVALRPEDKEAEDAFLSMKALEKQYASENALLQAVARGETHTAEMLLGAFPHAHVERRSISTLRDCKNYAIIANTLLRKAAEYGHVHPLHIDSLSSRFARSIEKAVSREEIYRLMREMARKYCLLVKNYSLQGYSPLVRDVLVRIGSDLTADLSLKTQASLLHVSASYLSTVFKKETGSSLTEFVNRKRVEYGIFLLNSTNLQIQTIAQHCGIPDLNYFTKTFKKYKGFTPSEYRSRITARGTENAEDTMTEADGKADGGAA